jgi:hypothetical protein
VHEFYFGWAEQAKHHGLQARIFPTRTY